MSVVFTEFHHDSNLGFCIFWGTDMTISDRLAAKAKQELEIIEPLSPQESRRYQAIKEELACHQDAFWSCFALLTEVKEEKLYRDEHATFEEFCQRVMGFSRQYANRMVAARQVLMELSDDGFGNESFPKDQLVAFAKVPPKERKKVLKKADAQAKKERRKRTAADVKAVAAKVKPDKPKAPKAELSKEEQIKAELKKARSYAEYLQRSIDDLNHLKRNAVHPELIKLCGQILKGLEKW